MTKDEIKQTVIDAAVNVSRGETIDPEKALLTGLRNDLGLDSLDLVEFSMDIEKACDLREVTDEEWGAVFAGDDTTIGEVYNFVITKLGDEAV